MFCCLSLVLILLTAKKGKGQTLPMALFWLPVLCQFLPPRPQPYAVSFVGFLGSDEMVRPKPRAPHLNREVAFKRFGFCLIHSPLSLAGTYVFTTSSAKYLKSRAKYVQHKLFLSSRHSLLLLSPFHFPSLDSLYYVIKKSS